MTNEPTYDSNLQVISWSSQQRLLLLHLFLGRHLFGVQRRRGSGELAFLVVVRLEMEK